MSNLHYTLGGGALKLAFWQGFMKKASPLLHTTELAGLGLLSVPSIKELRHSNISKRDKEKALYEIGGLGVLAIPSAYTAGKGTVGLLKKYLPMIRKAF